MRVRDKKRIKGKIMEVTNEQMTEIMNIIREPISIGKKSHHYRDQLCKTRAKYREGRKETAVKVSGGPLNVLKIKKVND